jgi:methyl-accepting chemotaxis protein
MNNYSVLLVNIIWIVITLILSFGIIKILFKQVSGINNSIIKMSQGDLTKKIRINKNGVYTEHESNTEEEAKEVLEELKRDEYKEYHHGYVRV